jgi:endonuclease YncB( thermonuclease family)
MAARKPDVRLVSSRPIPRKWMQPAAVRGGAPRGRGRKGWSGLIWFAVLAGVALSAAFLGRTTEPPSALGDGPIVGRVEYVVDGDTIDLHGQRIRLDGMDAPERDQSCSRADRSGWPCGTAATSELRELVRDAEIVCTPRDYDRYGRLVADCRKGVAQLGGAMVDAGLAVATTRYAGEERAARAAKRGIWQGDFERPSDWRRRMQTDPGTPGDPGSGNPSRFDRFLAWLLDFFSS